MGKRTLIGAYDVDVDSWYAVMFDYMREIKASDADMRRWKKEYK